MEMRWKSPSNMNGMVAVVVVVLEFFPLKSAAIRPNPFFKGLKA